MNHSLHGRGRKENERDRDPSEYDQEVLIQAIKNGEIAGAGLNVASTEPIQEDNILLKAKNCIITPHISWAAKDCRQRIMDCSAANLRAYLDGQPINVVNNQY